MSDHYCVSLSGAGDVDGGFSEWSREGLDVNLSDHYCVSLSGAGDVDGGFSEWSSWTQCSKSCGGGVKVRERSCTNPPPKGNGQKCSGEFEETGACAENPCPIRKPRL